MALLNRAGVAHLVNNSVGDGVADGGGPGAADSPGDLPGEGVADGPGGGVTDGLGDGGALWHAGADRDRYTDRVGDLAGVLDSSGVAHPPGLSVAVGGRGVSSNRSSSVSSSVESIGLSISLTLANVVVDKSSSVADSLHSSSNTGDTSNTGNTSSRGNSNTSNIRCGSNNVGRVGNVDGGLGADLLGDVLAVLDGGGVNNGGDFVVALLLLVALLHLGALL